MTEVITEKGGLTFFQSTYTNGRIAVWADNEIGEHIATLSVNVPDIPLNPEKDGFILNHDVPPKTAQRILDLGIFEDTGICVSYGFVRDRPVWRLVNQVRRSDDVGL